MIGTPLDLTNFRRREGDTAVKAAGFSGLMLRYLHHYAASALRDQGMDNKSRSTMIGHADKKIADTIYTHVNDVQVAKAATQFDPLAAIAIGGSLIGQGSRECWRHPEILVDGVVDRVDYTIEHIGRDLMREVEVLELLRILQSRLDRDCRFKAHGPSD